MCIEHIPFQALADATQYVMIGLRLKRGLWEWWLKGYFCFLFFFSCFLFFFSAGVNLEGFFLSFLPWSLFPTAGNYHTQPTSEPKSWSIEPCLIRSKSFIFDHLGPSQRTDGRGSGGY